MLFSFRKNIRIDYNWFKVLRKLGERAAVHLWKTIRSGEAFQSEILKVSAK